MKLATPKGFRDFLPTDALKRKFVLDKITKVFEKFGFDPLETPTLEYSEVLKGKYGEEEKLIYEFTTKGGDEVALRYDQTVPLARVTAQYGPNGEQKISLPFKRYQIQSSFRGENTQRGRYREFLQADADIVGSDSPLADAEILGLVYEIYKELGLDVTIKINDRALISDVEPRFLASLDKLTKIGEPGVITELQERGLSEIEAGDLLKKVQNLKESENLENIKNLYQKLGYPTDSLLFDPLLIRGLDYYTGLIIEVVLKSDLNGSSIGGGGRYDNLIGVFSNSQIPAVGFSVGLDRVIEAMEEAGILNIPATDTQILVTIFSPELMEKSVLASKSLRDSNVKTEIWLDQDSKLDKQLKYADQKGIPYVIIIGPDEASKNIVTLKDLRNKTQETLSLDEVIQKLSS